MQTESRRRLGLGDIVVGGSGVGILHRPDANAVWTRPVFRYGPVGWGPARLLSLFLQGSLTSAAVLSASFVLIRLRDAREQRRR